MPIEASRAVKLCGTEERDVASRVLKAGVLSAELEAGALRYIRLNGIEVIRAISFLVRDENWGTFTPLIVNLDISEKPDSFTVTYQGTCADRQRRLVYDAKIVGKGDGSLSFEVMATAETDVLTNRTGFVVLHPLAGVMGQPVKVLHTDGKETMERFPDVISPGQPIFDIAALSHEFMPGLWATCAMEGDAFEMEDQRNWTDASYKTYVRPLSDPWPYKLDKGSKHVQSVRLSVEGVLKRGVAEPVREVIATIGGETGKKLPAVGIGIPAEEAAHAVAAIEQVKALAPKSLVCQIDLRADEWESALVAYKQLAEATGAELVLEITILGDKRTDPAAELKAVAAAAAKAGLKPAAVMVSPASDLMSHQPGQEDPNVQPARAICAAARAAFPGVRLGGGVFSYFTELNRKRPPQGMLDFVSHTTCPIVHAADDRSVMESLEALPSVIASTRAFIGNAAYRIGPSAIGCRANPYGKGLFPNPKGGRVCLTGMDPRQRGLLGASWAIGYVAVLARGGIETVTMGAPTGPFGLIYRKTGYAQPYFDKLEGVAIYPAFHSMRGLARDTGHTLLDARCSRPRSVEVLAYRDGGKTTAWVANLTGGPHIVSLAGLPQGAIRTTVLDASNFEAAAQDINALETLARTVTSARLALDAYAVARVEVTS